MSEILKLEIEIDKHVYSIGQPITVQCTIINFGKNTIKLKPILFNDLEIYLKYGEDGESVPFGPIILLKELIRKSGIIKIGPEQPHSFIRTINEKAYVMPTRIGKYELYIVYQNRMDNLEKIKLWTGEVKSNIVKFEIE